MGGEGANGDLARAQGLFVVFLASLLQRAGVATMGEFGDLLQVFAASVAETEPDLAPILATWAATVQRSGQH